MAAQLVRYRDIVHQLGRARLDAGVERGVLARVTRGVYAAGSPAPVDEDRLRALFLRLPEGCLLGFQSAAERHGFGVLRTGGVHIAFPAGTPKPRIRGVIAHEAVLAVPEPVISNEIPCVPAARCAIDLARTVRRLDALPVLDAALRAGACEMDALRSEVARHTKLRGVRQARELVPFADARAECRQESQLRLILIDGRLPAPEPQVWVEDAYGSPRYRLDLGYRSRRVGIEYDGASHTDHDRLRYDRHRHNWLDSHGWTMRYFTDVDLYRRPAGIVDAVRTALR